MPLAIWVPMRIKLRKSNVLLSTKHIQHFSDDRSISFFLNTLASTYHPHRPIPGSSKNNLESLKKNLDKNDDFVYSIYLYLVVFWYKIIIFTALTLSFTSFISPCMHKYDLLNFIKIRNFIHILVFLQDKFRCLSQKPDIVNTATAIRRAVPVFCLQQAR